jgi:hypothetical protein
MQVRSACEGHLKELLFITASLGGLSFFVSLFKVEVLLTLDPKGPLTISRLQLRIAAKDENNKHSTRGANRHDLALKQILRASWRWVR